MKKHLTILGLLIATMVLCMSFIGCAEKQAVVKDEPVVQEQKVAPTQTVTEQPKAADDEAARRAKEQADREAALKAQAEKDARAKRNAAALADLNIQNIYFDFDKSNIRPDAREILKANAEIFNKNAGSKIVIEGHCDERGTAEYNMALGERRALETKKYLVNLGIDEARMETISYGKERPADPGHDESAWAQNRRAQFLLK
jgi:peptidoglycan-associated lipoprotein